MEQEYLWREICVMKRLLVYCEGPAEESFVKEVLAPYFWKINVSAFPTKANGVSKYSIIRKELLRHCKHDSSAMVTTMLDYYELPKETPGVETSKGSLYDIVEYIESAVERDMCEPDNLIFNLSVHEYEGLLFSRTSAFKGIATDKQIAILDGICKDFDYNPERINDSYDTTPSRRIKNVIPDYQKVIDGTRVAQRIDISGISSKCKHFHRWIEKLTTWAKEGTQ
jgi:hypothetical protein